MQVDGQGDGACIVQCFFAGVIGCFFCALLRDDAGMDIQGEQVGATNSNTNFGAEGEILCAPCLEHQRQRVGTYQAIFHDCGVQFIELALRQVLQCPVSLDA